MATKKWTGGAVDTQDLWTFTPGGTIVAGSTFTFTAGVIAWVYTTTASTVAGVCEELAEIWNSTNPAIQPPPAFRELQANDNTTNITFTGRVYGRSHEIGCTAGGSGSPSMTLVNTTPATGRNFPGNADNWLGGVAPANNDVLVFDSGNIDVSDGLDALAALTGVTVRVLRGARLRIGRREFVGTGNNRYADYRPRYLQLDGGTLEVDCPNIQRCNIDFQTTACSVLVRESGQREEDAPAVLVIGSHASNVAHIIKGDVGFAYYAGETAQFPVLKMSYRDNQQSDANVECGAGCTLGAVTKTGGNFTARSAVTTLTQSPSGGLSTLQEGGATTLNIDGGRVNYNASEIWTNCRVSEDGFLDFDQDTRTIAGSATINKYGNRSRIRDRNKRVNTAAMVVQCIRSDDLVGIEYGADFKVTFGAVS